MQQQSSTTYQTQNMAWQAKLQGVRLAEFRPRALAFAIDLAIVGLLMAVPALWSTSQQIEAGGEFSLSLDFDGLLGLAVFVAYFSLATFVGKGATVGKKLLGIQVISVVHDHLSLWHCVERALGYAASSLEAGFGFVQFFLHPNRQTVHDRIAETIVIRRPTVGTAAHPS
ncbi:MAG: hypothetical protein RL375_133 [Pseudomonadota bacterium]|jgi:uncharacterized RDD family membrane protein YckC